MSIKTVLKIGIVLLVGFFAFIIGYLSGFEEGYNIQVETMSFDD